MKTLHCSTSSLRFLATFSVVLIAGSLLISPRALAGNFTWTATGTSNWNSTSAWGTSASFPNNSTLDNVVGNTTTSITNVNGSYAINSFTATTGGWNIYGSTAGASLSINTLSSGVNLTFRDNAGTLAMSIGQLNVSGGSTSFGTTSAQVTSLNISTGVTMTGGSVSFNIGSDYSLGLLSSSGSTDSTVSLVRGSTPATRTITVSGISSTGSAVTTIQTNGAASSNVGTLTINNSSTYSTNAILADGGAGSRLNLVKTGVGTQILTGASTYTGTTTISLGTLLANNTTGSAFGSGPVNVESGGTLGGNGAIASATTVSGVLSPGSAGIGTLTVQSDVTWNGGSAWVMELGSGNVSDLLNITGAGSDFLKGSGSSWTFDFQNTGTVGSTYTLVDWAGTTSFVSGDFNYTNLATGLSGFFAINGTRLDFTVTAVPEPAASALVALAGLILLCLRRTAVRN